MGIDTKKTILPGILVNENGNENRAPDSPTNPPTNSHTTSTNSPTNSPRDGEGREIRWGGYDRGQGRARWEVKSRKGNRGGGRGRVGS